MIYKVIKLPFFFVIKSLKEWLKKAVAYDRNITSSVNI